VREDGVTLVELLVVVAVGAILIVLTADQIFRSFKGEEKVVSAARRLVADLQYAQAEARKQGSSETETDAASTRTLLKKRQIFVVFKDDKTSGIPDDEKNTYEIWRWQDEGDFTARPNNLPENGEFSPVFNNPNDDDPLKVGRLSDVAGNVRFGFPSNVTKKACTNGSGSPSSFAPFGSIPSYPKCSGKPCIRFNASGFPEVPSVTAVIYLTNGNDTYAVSVNRAGVIRICEWRRFCSNDSSVRCHDDDDCSGGGICSNAAADMWVYVK